MATPGFPVIRTRPLPVPFNTPHWRRLRGARAKPAGISQDGATVPPEALCLAKWARAGTSAIQ
jgi:hypothetical protein